MSGERGPKRRFPKDRDTRPGARLIVLGLGSNIDGPVQIDRAIVELTLEYDLLVRSTRYVGPPEIDPQKEPDTTAPQYSNASVLIRTADTFEDIRKTLRTIELGLGRDHAQKGEVAIHLDVLLIQNEVIRAGQTVIVPHPDLTVMRHAAIPSAEVAPFLRHAISAESLAEIAARLA